MLVGHTLAVLAIPSWAECDRGCWEFTGPRGLQLASIHRFVYRSARVFEYVTGV